MTFQTQVYAKTPIGDEAVRQSSRVAQRNLRMVLVQVDGKLSVEELSVKIGNPSLVEKALRELADGGFIVPVSMAPKLWQDGKREALALDGAPPESRFSILGPSSVGLAQDAPSIPPSSGFSSFGKPILPAAVPPPDDLESFSEKPDSDRRRQRGKWLLRISLGLPVLLLFLFLVFPYDRFKPDLEAAIGHYLKTGVHIDHVSVAIWPRPALVLSKLQLGEGGDSLIEKVRVGSIFSLLMQGPYQIAQVELVDARLPTDHLIEMLLFRDGTGSSNIAIEQLSFQNLSLMAGGFVLEGLAGEVKMNKQKIEKAVLQNQDRSLRISAKPSAEGLLLDIEAFGWASPYAGLKFDLLQADCLLRPGHLVIRHLDGRLLAGGFQGKGLIDWRDGLAMSGDARLSSMDGRRVAAAFAPWLRLDGELSGQLHLQTSGKNFATAFDQFEATLDTVIEKGVLHGVDLSGAAHRGGSSDIRAGATKFDRLQGLLAMTAHQVSGQNMQMTSGMLSATGQFVARHAGAIEGSALIMVNSSVAPLKQPVRIFGTLPELTVSGRK